MTKTSKTILEQYQVRKSGREKAGFRDWLCGELTAAGYSPAVEQSAFAHNVVVGDPERAEVFFTAHYDTQAVLPIPNFITPRNMGWYLLYQLALVVPMFLIAALAEVLVILLFDPPIRVAVWAFTAVMLFFCWWLFFGPANRHTVNDNTSGVITLVETALALPPEDRDRVCFVFFDNEERGMLGSSAFAGKHKKVRDGGLVVNFDCVSDGESVQFFPTKGLKQDEAALKRIEASFLPQGGKEVEVVRGFGFYPSDNAAFRRAAGVCALKKSRTFGWYMDRIHTAKDTVMQEENIELLRDGCLRLAAGTQQ